MKKEKELVKNTIILGIGKFLPKLIAIVTLPILTARLTKAEFGTYDLISTLVMLLLPVATLQLQSAAFRFLIDCRDDKEKVSSIISNIFIATVPVSIVVSIAIMFFWQDVEPITKILIGIYFFVDIIHITIGQITRGLAHNKEYSINTVLYSLINGLGIVLLIQVNDFKLNGVLISLIISNILAIIYLSYVVKLPKYFNFKLKSKATIKEMAKYSWPMIPNNLSNWILKLSDRLVIKIFIGIEANAIYAAANKIPNLLSIAQSIFTMAWHENASIAVKDKDATEYYTKMFSRVLNIMFSCTALLIAFTPILFKLTIKGNYEESYIQMPILILAMFFFSMSAFQGGIYIAHKKTKSIGITTMAAAACNLIIDLALVNVIGVTSASLSTLISYFLLYVYRLIDVQKFQKMKYEIKKQIIYVVIMIGMLIMCAFKIKALNIINLILGIMIFIIFNWKYVDMAYKKITNKFKKNKE